jgi:hypothetical protein
VKRIVAAVVARATHAELDSGDAIVAARTGAAAGTLLHRSSPALKDTTKQLSRAVAAWSRLGFADDEGLCDVARTVCRDWQLLQLLGARSGALPSMLHLQMLN